MNKPWRVKRKKLERHVEKAGVRIAKEFKLIAIKLNILGRRGWPDRMMLGKNRCIFFIEFKRKGEVPTELQSSIHKLLRKWGFNVYVVDTEEQARKVISGEVRAAQVSSRGYKMAA